MRKTYTPQKLDDGTTLIEGVEVFQLGEHRDFPFDADWFERCQKSHQRFEQTGFAPNVIIGHGKWDGEEPVFGDFQNVRLADDGVTVLVDYLLSPGIDPTIFNSYPHRSVRVNPERAYFAHVAQLGSSEPHFKLPSMHIPAEFSADPDEAYQIFEFNNAEQDEFLNNTAADAPNTEPSTDFTTLKAQLEAEIADFRAKLESVESDKAKLAQDLRNFRNQTEIEQAEAQFQALVQAGIAKPVADKWLQFRKSLICADTPLEFTSTSPDGHSNTVNLTEFAREFEQMLFKRLADNSLVAQTKPASLPFNSQTDPALPEHNGDAEFEAAQDRSKKVRNYLKTEKGKPYAASEHPNGWTTDDYKAAEAEMIAQNLL